MVKNREELMAMSSEWMGMAMNDLRRQMISFMESVGASEDELAHILCISPNELNAIIDGGDDISLSTFAKLLIATDNVVEIKPISATPFKNVSNMPRPNGRRVPPMGGMLGGTPTPFGMPMTRPEMGRSKQKTPFGGMATNLPMRDERGRFVKRNHQIVNDETVQGFVGNPTNVRSNQELPKVPRRELVSTIIANGWDEAIDIINSTSDELMRFLMTKGLTPQHFERMANQHENVAAQNESPQIDEAENEQIMRMIEEELRRNPQLFDTVRKYVRK